MNRADFKKIANIRLKEAKVLLVNGSYDGAYYLGGYVVECALKACIAKNTKKYDFPDDKTVRNSYSHDIEQLVGVAGLKANLTTAMRANAQFATNWAIVKDWDETSRYEQHNLKKARDLYNAIANSQDGVLKWIKHYW
jgi:HEPN domain-containing protein